MLASVVPANCHPAPWVPSNGHKERWAAPSPSFVFSGGHGGVRALGSGLPDALVEINLERPTSIRGEE